MIFALGILALSGCESAANVSPLAGNRDGLSTRQDKPFDFGGDCQTAIVGFKSKGGRVGFPNPPGSPNFYAHVYYAPYEGRDQDVGVVACPGSDNGFNLPVPPGYAPDWFERLVYQSSPITFESGALFGEMYSTTWVPKVAYVLNVYDDQNNLLESSQMGPLKKKKALLKFASPFENGLTVPSDGFLYLEIAHPTP